MDPATCQHTLEVKRCHKDGWNFVVAFCPACRGAWPDSVLRHGLPAGIPTWTVADDDVTLVSSSDHRI